MKILLGVDGSKYSDWAAEYLSALPFIAEPKIHLLHVVESQTHNVPMMIDDDTRNKVLSIYREKGMNAGKKILAKLQKTLSSRFNSFKVELEEGDIANKLIGKAEKKGIDMVMVGSRGLSNITAFVLGSISQKVMTYAPCSVLIVKKRTRTVKHILVAVDGSKYSDLLVDSIISWFSPGNMLVTVINVPSYEFVAEKVPVAEKYAALLEKAGFKTRTIYATGNPAKMILGVVAQKRADLVVVGSKGTVGLQRFLLGSVSRKVATYSEAPVLVLRGRA